MRVSRSLNDGVRTRNDEFTDQKGDLGSTLVDEDPPHAVPPARTHRRELGLIGKLGPAARPMGHPLRAKRTSAGYPVQGR